MTAQPIPLRRFYVYVLKNEAGEVFYVGRGTGGRMMQHLARSHNEGVNGRLSEAVAGDERVTAEVVSWHSTAADAADEERKLIKSFPPHVLANLVHIRRPRAAPKDTPLPDTPRLREVARLAEMARFWEGERDRLAEERNALIREIGDDHTLAVLANAAGISHSRVSHIVGNRGAKVGRPRRATTTEPRQPGRRPKGQP